MNAETKRWVNLSAATSIEWHSVLRRQNLPPYEQTYVVTVASSWFNLSASLRLCEKNYSANNPWRTSASRAAARTISRLYMSYC